MGHQADRWVSGREQVYKPVASKYRDHQRHRTHSPGRPRLAVRATPEIDLEWSRKGLVRVMHLPQTYYDPAGDVPQDAARRNLPGSVQSGQQNRIAASEALNGPINRQNYKAGSRTKTDCSSSSAPALQRPYQARHPR
jgi:hypothetical protein